MRRGTSLGSKPGRALGLALALVIVGAVFGGALERSTRPPTGERAGRPPETVRPVPAVTRPPTDRSDAPASAASAPAVSGRLVGARPRSPLERSPGYYPPDDPESLSVLTGRREAPAVDAELSGGGISLEDLARKLLAALTVGDERAMHALRVSRSEFEQIFWPEFPQSRQVTGIQAADAWELSTASSLAGASRAIGLCRGRDLKLVRIVEGAPSAYRNFTLRRGVRIVARDRSSGQDVMLDVAPSVAERHGRFKALLFKDG